MSHQIVASELIVELSTQEQELLAGGVGIGSWPTKIGGLDAAGMADFELSGSNFANRLGN